MQYLETGRGYSRATVILGWLIMAFYSAQSYLSARMSRVDRFSPLREDLRHWHYLVGLTLFVLLVLRLWRWFGERPASPAAGMTASGHHWARTLTLSFYLVLVVMPVFGINQAWTDGLRVQLGPFFTLPALVHENRALWMFTGYSHSALAFATILLTFTGVLTIAWFAVRRGVSALNAFPPGFGAQLWVSMLILLWAISTFKEPGNPVPFIGGFLLLTVVVIALRLRRGRSSRALIATQRARAGARIAAPLAIALLLAPAAYAPRLVFRLSPWPIGEAVAAPEGATSHAAAVTTVTVTPETDYEREVKTETYKWCRFCHTVEKDAKHMAGPNLYAIFGQRAGTGPNFYYSKAMAAAGRGGLVWTDATLDQFLAGPDEFLPGTSMTISIGPIKDPKARAAIINLLKRETMPPSAVVPASPEIGADSPTLPAE